MPRKKAAAIIEDHVPHCLPVNLQYIVQNAIQIFHIDQSKLLVTSIPLYYRHSEQVTEKAERMPSEHYSQLLYAFLNNLHYSQTCEAFDWVLGEVEAKFNQSLINPGPAAQSIGELTT